MRLFKIRELIFWIVVSLWTVGAVWPMSFWYETGEIRIDDYQVGEQMEIIYNGEVKRDVKLSYSVIIRQAETNKIISEESSSIFNYRPGSIRPDPITIEWWAPASFKSHNLNPGAYYMTTCWTAPNMFGGIVPSKVSCAESNIFVVTNPEKYGRERKQNG